MKRFRILALAAVLLLAASCGSASKPSTAGSGVQQRTVQITDKKMVIYSDDQNQTRKSADRIFDAWATSRNMKRNITSRQLRSLSPKTDGCHLTYEFRVVDGTRQKVTLVVTNYETKQYRNRRRGTVPANR